MPTIYLETSIEAPIERCFDLALSVDLHQLSVARTLERPIAGVTSGVMRLGDTVTWEAVHFGVRQHLTTQITAYERPYRFTDEMVRGIFHRLKHVHEFRLRPPGVLMVDQFSFRAPLGPLGWITEQLVLTRYLRGFLLIRNQFLKQMAEAGAYPDNPGQWPSLLPHSSTPA
jgi:ligand-binding SRPBCC domain-containing protein